MAELTASSIDLTLKGEVAEDAPDYARDKVAAVASSAKDPILHAAIALAQENDPARERPAIAEATLDVNGRPVRAQVAATDMLEAIDLMVDRLTRRLRRYEDQVHHGGRERYRTGEAGEGEWRHGDLPSQRADYFDRPYEERELVRTKRFDLTPTSVDEAIFDLDMLGHDFYLFTEASTGQDAVVFLRDGRPLALQLPEGTEGDPTDGAADEVELVAPAARLSRTEAIERLESGKERFVFFIEDATGRGAVAYHRYDGNWGLISAQ